jgi:Holliday junction resolvase RusA-like endonuclease
MIIENETKNHTITLWYPTSANRYWKNFRGRMVVSAEAKAYKAHVCSLARSNGIGDPTPAPVALALTLHPVAPKDWPKRQAKDPRGFTVRCMDLSNCVKVAEDALQGIAYLNDNQVMELSIKRGLPVPDGALVVTWSLLLDGDQDMHRGAVK